jgi:hypothetical protein
MARWGRLVLAGMVLVGSLGWSGTQARAAEPPAAPAVSATYKGAPLADCYGQSTCPEVVVFDDPVTFTFASGSPDVVRYRYGFSGQPVGEVDGGSSVTIDVRPPRPGLTQLSVQAINSIGQFSTTSYFLFNVANPPGPVGSWTFDDSSGTTAADGSGNGQTLTLHGGSLDDKGRLGGSLALDAADYAQTAGPVVDTSQSFSIAAWVRPAAANRLGVVAAASGTTSPAAGLGYDPGTKRWVFARTSADTSSPHLYRASSTEAPVNGAWTHLLATYDAGTGQMALYVNGRLQQTTTIPAANAWKATGPLTVGAFAGSLDQLQIWQRVLHADEIAALQDPRIGGRIVPGLAASWPLDSVERGSDRVWRTSETVRGAGLTVSGFGSNPSTAFVDDSERGRVLELTGGTRQSLTLDRAVVDGSASFTVAAWVKVTDMTKPGVIARQGTSTRDAWRLAYRPLNDFQGQFTFTRADGSGTTETVATYDVDVDSLQDWHVLAGTYNRTDGRIELTFDNAPFNGCSQPYSAPTRFGTTTVGAAPTFTGRLDELHVYAGVLTQSRACTDYPGLPGCGS